MTISLYGLKIRVMFAVTNPVVIDAYLGNKIAKQIRVQITLRS
jgi:hypothetical protein